jgi:hypothetical protein
MALRNHWRTHTSLIKSNNQRKLVLLTIASIIVLPALTAAYCSQFPTKIPEISDYFNSLIKVIVASQGRKKGFEVKNGIVCRRQTIPVDGISSHG